MNVRILNAGLMGLGVLLVSTMSLAETSAQYAERASGLANQAKELSDISARGETACPAIGLLDDQIMKFGLDLSYARDAAYHRAEGDMFSDQAVEDTGDMMKVSAALIENCYALSPAQLQETLQGVSSRSLKIQQDLLLKK
jgi:hypothetical protein